MHYPGETPRWRRYLNVIRREASADVDDELRFHFESRIEELVSQGMDAAAAREQAVREFGDVGAVRAGLVDIGDRVARKRRRSELLFDLLRDVGYAIRTLRRTPAVAVGILLTLALGVGANAAMFTLLDAIFLRQPAGVVQPDGVHRVWMLRHFSTGIQYSTVATYVQLEAIRGAVGNRAQMTVYRIPESMRVGTGELAAQAQVSYVGDKYFEVLGVRPSIGRLFSPEENRVDAQIPVVVISEAYWKRVYDGSPEALGQTITIAGAKYTIIGVAANDFTGVDLNAVDAWLPISLGSSTRPGQLPWWKNKRVNGLTMLSRASAGANERELEQRMTTVLRHPDVAMVLSDTGTTAQFGGLIATNGPGQKSKEEQIAVRLVGVSLIVLIIACANVVNLLLARSVRRRREIAVRLALGVSKSRLIRLLLAESAVISVLAAIIAVVVAYCGGSLLRTLLLPQIHWANGPLDWRVIGLALVTAIGAGLIAGLIPAVQSASPELTGALKIGTGSETVQHSRLRASLVVAQSALSVLLLVGAMLFVKSLSNVQSLDLGYDAASTVIASVRFDGGSRDSTVAARIPELADRLRAVRGVDGVAMISVRPMSDISFMTLFGESDSIKVPGFFPLVTGVSRGFFATAGLRILRGEDFPARGSATPPSFIVNQQMAKTLWPGLDPIGQCLRFGARNAPCFRVSAVVENAHLAVIEKDDPPQYYVSFDNLPDSAKWIKPYYVALRVPPEQYAAVAKEIRSNIRAVFPEGIPTTTRLSETIDPQYRPYRLGAYLFSGLGVLALLVAVVGIYSTVAYGVNQRIHEFGVRIALGASVKDVVSLVIGAGVRTVAVGIAVGIGLALIVGRLIATLLYGVAPRDPMVLATVSITLLLISVLAALAPAWRASRVDPVSALRAD